MPDIIDEQKIERDKWLAERQEFRKQIDELKAENRQKQNEVDRYKAGEHEKQREIDSLHAELNILRNNQSGNDNERTYLMGEIDRYRQECNEMRGHIRGMEFVISAMGKHEQ